MGWFGHSGWYFWDLKITYFGGDRLIKQSWSHFYWCMQKTKSRENTVHPLCSIASYVSGWVFVRLSFLKNPKPENPGKLLWNAPCVHIDSLNRYQVGYRNPHDPDRHHHKGGVYSGESDVSKLCPVRFVLHSTHDLSYPSWWYEHRVLEGIHQGYILSRQHLPSMVHSSILITGWLIILYNHTSVWPFIIGDLVFHILEKVVLEMVGEE